MDDVEEGYLKNIKRAEDDGYPEIAEVLKRHLEQYRKNKEANEKMRRLPPG